jgi:hypothetical protein
VQVAIEAPAALLTAAYALKPVSLVAGSFLLDDLAPRCASAIRRFSLPDQPVQPRIKVSQLLKLQTIRFPFDVCQAHQLKHYRQSSGVRVRGRKFYLM